ncbi:hypothetical protein GCM10025777_50150 [Membranihabitans marinus]|uniref:Potassium channel domain-containing protein n=2 Tax=Nesterenkonia rhizosphaerae TaxID=1348272 RepID=A0ABP9FR31_9MICC
MGLMNTAITLVGILLIMVGLRDMFHQLLHPPSHGSLSRGVFSVVWRMSRVMKHRLGTAVGPGAMVLVIVLWVLLQVFGWALVYLPHVPEDFSYSDADPTRYPDFADALYVSLVTLATLGFGDVVAVDPVLRLVTPLQGLTGFALLTASLTWFIQIYPPLSRRRALAMSLNGMKHSRFAQRLADLQPAVAAVALEQLTRDIAQSCIDFNQYGETYYFREQHADLSLARYLPYTLEIRAAAGASTSPDVQLSGERFGFALQKLSEKLSHEFLSGNTPQEVFAAYAADHRAHQR